MNDNAETLPELGEAETAQAMGLAEQPQQLPVEVRARKALNFESVKQRVELLPERSAHITAVSSMADHADCHRHRMELKNTRCAIQRAGKDARADATAFAKAVKAAEDELVALIEPEEQRLQGLQSAFEERMAAEKAERERQEALRVARENEAFRKLLDFAVRASHKGSAQIEELLRELADFPLDDIAPERHAEAETVRAEQADKLRLMLSEAQAVEETAARLQREREELERQREQLEALRAKQEAEAKAAREAAEAELQRQRDQLEAQRAELQRQQDEARAAAEAEQRRQAEERQAAERAREEEEARQRAEAERAERERQAEERRQREAAEAKAKAEREAAEAAERARAIREASTLEAVGEALLLLRKLAPDHIATAKLERVYGELHSAQAVQP